MKNIIIIGVVIVVIIITAVVLMNGKSSRSTPSNINIAPNPTSAVAVTPNSVSIQNFSFNPVALTVKTGTTVTWTNNDSTTHTIKSATFNSGDLNQGDTFKFTFDAPGTFNYSCGIHPTMTGTIIVQ